MLKAVRWRFVVLVVIMAFAAIYFAAEVHFRTHYGIGGDFGVFWAVGQRSVEQLYHDANFAYPPSSLPLMDLVGLLPRWPAYFLLMGLSMAAFYSAGRRLYSRTAVLMGLASPAMFMAIGEGQMAPLLAAMMFLAFSSPPVAKGAIVALVLSIKPQFAFIAPLVLWSDRKAFVSMAGTGLILLAVYVALWGVETWVAWLEQIPRFNSLIRERGIDVRGVSLAGEALDYGYPFLPALVLALVISVYLAIRKPIDDMAVLIVGCSIFASPYALHYDLVALTPWAAERLLKDRVDGWMVPKVLLYVHLLFPIAWLLSVLPSRRSETEGVVSPAKPQGAP